MWKNLIRPLNLGLDSLKIQIIGTNWCDTGNLILSHKEQIPVESLEMTQTGPMILAKCNMVPARSLTVVNVKVD